MFGKAKMLRPYRDSKAKAEGTKAWNALTALNEWLAAATE